VGGSSTSSHDNKKFRTRSMEKQRGMAFGFRKTATAVKKTGQIDTCIHIKVKWSRYRPSVTQKVGRGIALLFHDRGSRRRWLVSSTTRPHFTPGKDPVPILHEAGWAPGTVWTGIKSRPHRDSIPDRPARSQSLYQLSYLAHPPTHIHTHTHIYIYIYIYS